MNTSTSKQIKPICPHDILWSWGQERQSVSKTSLADGILLCKMLIQFGFLISAHKFKFAILLAITQWLKYEYQLLNLIDSLDSETFYPVAMFNNKVSDDTKQLQDPVVLIYYQCNLQKQVSLINFNEYSLRANTLLLIKKILD